MHILKLFIRDDELLILTHKDIFVYATHKAYVAEEKYVAGIKTYKEKKAYILHETIIIC